MITTSSGHADARRGALEVLTVPRVFAGVPLNSATCWNVGRFCQSNAGCPTMLAVVNWMSSKLRIVPLPIAVFVVQCAGLASPPLSPFIAV